MKSGNNPQVITLKLPDKLLELSSKCAQILELSRSAYIREAIARMNQETYKKIKAKRISAASKKVRQESMRVNLEFSKIEHDPET